MATVYLIHFDHYLNHALHYLGYTAKEDAEARLARHRRGDGARILRICNERGITYNIVKTWHFPDWRSARDFERKLKRRHGAKKLCPVCNGAMETLTKR